MFSLTALFRSIAALTPPAPAPPMPAALVAAPRGFQFGRTSEMRLERVHPDLVKVMRRAITMTPLDFTVLEGRRTIERQRALVARGASKTMNSRHLTGHAVDIAPLDEDGDVSWDWPLYHQLAPIVKEAARLEGVPIEWGGDWRSFKDGPHWQLPWGRYPK